MNKFYKLLAMLFASLAVAFVGCDDVEPEPTPIDPFEGASIKVQLVGADINVATLSVKAEVINVASYIVAPVADKIAVPTAEEIFANGTLLALEKEGATQLTLRSLEAETEYEIYFAGRITANKVWPEVTKFTFKTQAEPIVPVLTAKLEGTTATTATISLYAENIARVAHVARLVTEDEGVPNQQVIFATGKVVQLVQGDNTIEVEYLSPNKEYVVYIAAEVAGIEEYMDEVLTVKYIKTADFTEDVAVRDLHYRGFTVDVKVDPSVKEQNHVIKWATSSTYLYNRNGGGNGRDADLMNLHDTAWNGMNLFNESRSIIIDEEHSYIYNEYGEPDNWYYESIVPGQPQVVMFGEYRRGESPWGWGVGYYKPLFDMEQYMIDSQNGPVDEAAYWDGFYKNIRVQVRKPEPLPAELITVEIDAVPDDAIVKVTADESLDQVAIMIMSELEHNTAIKWLDEEHMQWFATSIEGMYEGVTMIVDPYNEEANFNGTIQTALTEYFYDVPRDSKYWVDVVGLRGDFDGDGFLDGYEQVYHHYEFYLPEPTKPAPELEVVALESTSPYSVSFNVKCPTKDAKKGKAIANYEKEWLTANMSASEIVDYYGIDFTSVELMKINSDEGYTMTYPSRPNSKTYLAAMVANDEGTETFSDAVIAESLIETAKERVESELFESLKGEWTASATVSFSIYNEELEDYEPKTETHTCTVTIGDVEYPETLTEDVYETFARHGVTRTATDLYFAEFKEAANTFNENTRAQNRILMNGWDFTNGYQSYFAYASPFDLFISDTYNGHNSESPLYDFGPKWFLEVAADGTVTAPFNVNYFTPMSSWYTQNGAIYESHFVAYEPQNAYIAGLMSDEEGNGINGYFPVEISEDGNTITVKPLVYSELNFYPNAGINYGSGTYAIAMAVTSEVVLTRNTAATAAPAKANKRIVGKVEQKRVQADHEVNVPARPASRSTIGEKVEFQNIGGPKDLTREEKGKLWFESRKLK